MKTKAHILVVEDERIVSEDIKRSLLSMGYSLTDVVSTGKAALESVSRARPDLILMDIVLNGEMDGIRTAERIRSKYNIPMIYLTAHADEDTLEKAKKTGPYGYLIKPFENRELQSSIEMALYKHGMEARLRESEAWFSTTLRSIGDGVIATDRQGKITFMNSVAETLTQWPLDEAAGLPLHDVFHLVRENDDSPVNIPLSVVLDQETVMALPDHTILVSRNGNRIPVDDSVASIRTQSGEIIGAVLIFHNIAERKLVEEALRESEERYRNIFEDSRDAIYITTCKGKFVIANQSALEMFDYAKEEILHVNISDLFADPAVWHRLAKEMDARGSVRDFEIRMKNRSAQELICLMTATVRRGGNGRVLGYQGVIRNITQHKRTEEEKERIQAQLLQAQKMEAIGILAGGVAHDFNNLLTVIQGNSDLALMKLESGDALYRDLQEIQRAAARAADLTSQLLLFSRKQPMRFSTLDLNKGIEEMLKMLHRLIGEDIGVSTDLEASLCPVEADRGTMEQVIMNLAVNARDAMPDGGRLIIRTRNVILNSEDCKAIPESRPGRFVIFSMADTGIGMDEATQERIFEPFFSTKGPGRGTGLGLSVVYGIIKQHNGWIQIQSTPGMGTTFHIYLPAAENRNGETEDTMVDPADLKGRGERILVVEDEAGVKDFTETALSQHGYRVVSARSSDEALKRYEESQGAFDLMISDVVLPDRSGLKLVEEIHAMNAAIPVILTSGYTGPKSQWSLIQKKGFPFMQKPYTLTEMLRMVKTVLLKKEEGPVRENHPDQA